MAVFGWFVLLAIVIFLSIVAVLLFAVSKGLTGKAPAGFLPLAVVVLGGWWAVFTTSPFTITMA